MIGESHTVLGHIRVDKGLVIEDDFLTLTEDDRFEHMAIYGATGVGKSTMMLNTIEQDMRRRAKDGGYEGVLVVDPTGSLAEAVLDLVPRERENHVCYINATDPDYAVGIDLLSADDPDRVFYLAESAVGAMRDIFSESWGERLDDHIRASILAISDAGLTFVMLRRFLLDDDYRAKVLKKVTNPYVVAHFEKVVDPLNDAQTIEQLSSVRNKIGQFVLIPSVRAILGQRQPKFDMEHAMESGRIVIVNTGKGQIGEKPSYLLGALIISRAKAAVLARSRLPPGAFMRPFYIHCDEAQNYATKALVGLYDEARKYRVSLSTSTQFTANLPDDVRAAAFGNANTVVSFRVGFDDAVDIGNEMQVKAEHLQDLDRYRTYIRSHAYSKAYYTTMLPRPITNGRRQEVLSLARKHYERPRDRVEHTIRKDFGFVVEPTKPRTLSQWSQVSSANIKRDLSAEFCVALAAYDAGDGLSHSRGSDRYAPKILATVFKGVSVRDLAAIMGQLLAEGKLQAIKVKVEGRPQWTKLIVAGEAEGKSAVAEVTPIARANNGARARPRAGSETAD